MPERIEKPGPAAAPHADPRSGALDDPLAVLEVIDRLEVGPVRVERNRLIAPYRVVQDKRTSSFDLIYRFEEDVFDPAEAASLNLASMMAAQVALNYGLFCKQIVFRGLFDKTDRRFIDHMMRNTAREIYVKKFLEPNPFLRGPAARLPVIKRANYVRSELIFTDEQSAVATQPELRLPAWSVDRGRHTVLSSGGKDSLLSYALLNEMQRETHSIFVNESGKHWFTALNAYRHFEASVPHTARVWTNADRLFNWIVRQLPFVREDFLEVRADMYPIRLWTVAVFVFGVLPLVRKRGIGRIVIGDEYDTTLRMTHQGIPHYNGLYDQSRFFDNAMTRYYLRKRWGCSQFSLVRPLSELLIQKILSERYPELQKNQVSCHATHMEGGRVRPCGQCEKCRRIVGMTMAIGGDPSACGYSPKQIQSCLKSLAARGASQEIEGVQHMLFLLAGKGLLTPGGAAQREPAAATNGPKPSASPSDASQQTVEASSARTPVSAPRTPTAGVQAAGAARPQTTPPAARERPEVLKLRFDPERSPMVGIPADLREQLYRIWLNHATGAVKRNAKLWTPFDPFTDKDLLRPYPFESFNIGARSERLLPGDHGAAASPKRNYILGELTWPEARVRFGEVDVALLPVGATEQHGHHLPLDTDAFDAEYLCREVAAGCAEPRPLVLPMIPYGVSYQHEDFSGTISIGPETLSKLVYEIGMCVVKHGVTKLLIVNGHGGNSAALQLAAQMIHRDAHIFTCVDSGETSDADINALAETRNDVHAGEIETSTSLALRPDLVHMDKARKSVPRFSSRYLVFSSRRSVDWYAHTSKISSTGVLGDPTKATAEKGLKMWRLMIDHLVAFVEELKSLSLDELHHKGRF